MKANRFLQLPLRRAIRRTADNKTSNEPFVNYTEIDFFFFWNEASCRVKAGNIDAAANRMAVHNRGLAQSPNRIFVFFFSVMTTREAPPSLPCLTCRLLGLPDGERVRCIRVCVCVPF